jgi:hypothetical protein
VPGQPYWIPDRSQPSGKALNPAAFSLPPAGQAGDCPRNGLRSPYSINQTDIALRRRFNLSERVKLDVRAEYFNVFNHPMFGLPGSQCARPMINGLTQEARSIQTLGRYVPQRTSTRAAAVEGVDKAHSTRPAVRARHSSRCS